VTHCLCHPVLYVALWVRERELLHHDEDVVHSDAGKDEGKSARGLFEGGRGWMEGEDGSINFGTSN